MARRDPPQRLTPVKGTRTEAGERLLAILESKGYLTVRPGPSRGASIRFAELQETLLRQLGPGHCLSNTRLANILYHGTELTVPVVVALAKALSIDARLLLYDNIPTNHVSEEIRISGPLDFLNRLMPIDGREPGDVSGYNRKRKEYRYRKTPSQDTGNDSGDSDI